jgi:hypothetical protein
MAIVDGVELLRGRSWVCAREGLVEEVFGVGGGVVIMVMVVVVRVVRWCCVDGGLV